MKTPKALAIILAACLAMAVGPGGSPAEAAGTEQFRKTIITQISSTAKHEDALKLASYPKDIRANYQAILTHVLKTNADYVSQSRRRSPTLEDAIKKHGLERIVAIGNEAHRACLDLALERINKYMPGAEFDRRTKEIAEQYYGNMQKVNVSAPINFTKQVVVQASQQKMILDTLFYEKLLKPNFRKKITGDYTELLESAFSKEEYSKQVVKQLAAIDNIYDALLKARVGFRGLFAVSGINKARGYRKQHCKEQAKKVYVNRRSGNLLAGKTKEPLKALSLVLAPNKQVK
ncbi:MAG: hypothetical protein GWP14_09950 [Actinobacteria bacterium]|nr:hypothetical protein [Actinomycetota bacterium]